MKHDYIGSLVCGMPKEYQIYNYEGHDVYNDVQYGEDKYSIFTMRLCKRQLKLNILKWLIPLLIITFVLSYQYEHDPRIIEMQQQYEQQIKMQQKEIKQLKFEVVKARQVRSVMRRYGCYDHRIFKVCMDQQYLKPVEAAIFVAIESEFNPNAISSCGAKGSMQIMDCWGLKNPYDIKSNIEFGCRLYRRYLDKYKSWDLAISAFNAGEGAVQMWDGVPPYQETLAYIRVFKWMNRIYGVAA